MKHKSGYDRAKLLCIIASMTWGAVISWGLYFMYKGIVG